MKSKPYLKRKFLIISRWGETLDLALAIQNEGNEVKFFIDEKEYREIGDGFVPKIKTWKTHVKWADIVIFDYTGYSEEAKELRASGTLVFGGSTYTDNLELDRNFGNNELKKHKIKTLPAKEFVSFEDAITYVKAHPDAYVIKPSGETQELKQLLFVGNDDGGLDVIRVLGAYEKSWGNTFGNFQLQKKVKGVEISVSAFFNGTEFLKPLNITFEHKKLFPKELGVSTGEMGTSMFWVNDSPIFDATLKKFEATFPKSNFIGHIDINCIVNGNGIYPLEFTSRFGYPQILIQRAGITEPIGNLLYYSADGKRFHCAIFF